jgi:hypothetical protein
VVSRLVQDYAGTALIAVVNNQNDAFGEEGTYQLRYRHQEMV